MPTVPPKGSLASDDLSQKAAIGVTARGEFAWLGNTV
jgi:hypothetical protein